MDLAAELRHRRARKEAKGVSKDARAALRKHGHRLSDDVVAEIKGAADTLDAACAKKDHDEVCAGMVRLEDLTDRHLAFAKKSTFREYADSIGVAVLIALLLRAFVVEAFKIPSGSMIPTMQVGDHIFVNKFIYGLRIPFTHIRFFDFRKPHRGEVIVFEYPEDTSKDFIKRIVAVPGDSVAVRRNVLYLNGQPVPHEVLPDPDCQYWDFEEMPPGVPGHWAKHFCEQVQEHLGDETFVTYYDPNGGEWSWPDGRACPKGTHKTPDDDACTIEDGGVFVMGDNRMNSHDSRYWGTVPYGLIKGKALVIWWSSGSPAGVRWDRMGKLVH